MRALLSTGLTLAMLLSWGGIGGGVQAGFARTGDGAATRPLTTATPAVGTPFTFGPEQKKLLLRLEGEGIQYFLDNQLDNGLIQDRQTNFEKSHGQYQCSLSATGMGLIAIALASGPQFKKISREDAIARVHKALLAAKKLPEVHGMMPHFFDPVTLKWKAPDQVSTIDSSWLIAGGLWAAQYLQDAELSELASELYDRVDWQYWADTDTKSGAPVLSMGMGEDGKRFKSTWDRINSEAAFMYVLAIGARQHALPAEAWKALKPYNVKVAGTDLAGGDLGLFSFQYSNDLMDLQRYPGNQINLHDQSLRAAKANYDTCKSKAGQYRTYKHFWGLSAGDGPPAAAKSESTDSKSEDTYRAYAPGTDVDGTAHVMATLASIDVTPKLVQENIDAAETLKAPKMHGRYGYSNINLDKNWVSKDVVGIDVGVAVIALDNELSGDEVRKLWQALPCSKRAEERLKLLK
ncbi:MAG: hypothetical protein KGS72_16895 [Cyanobacteria bacterium REEB67]|nr:hypothetical protein [Cyanobacteria bacterium REEB67]